MEEKYGIRSYAILNMLVKRILIEIKREDTPRHAQANKVERQVHKQGEVGEFHPECSKN